MPGGRPAGHNGTVNASSTATAVSPTSSTATSSTNAATESSSTAPTLRILHLSDTHLTGDGALHYGTVNTREHLQRVLAMVEHRPIDLIVCSGDVSDDGSIASYEIARDVIGEFAARKFASGAAAAGDPTATPDARAASLPVVFAMGNHDLLDLFEQVLGPAQRVLHVNGWRIIVLNTAVPGAGYGELGAEQLEFLRHVLHGHASDHAHPHPAGQQGDVSAPHGSIVVMHHPPIPAQTDLLQALNLDDQDARTLAEILAGSDVRAILSGHYHQAITELFAGVPVIVTPGVANLSRPMSDPREEASVVGWGGTLVTLTSGGSVRAVPFTGTPHEQEAFRFTRQKAEQIACAAGRNGEEGPSSSA